MATSKSIEPHDTWTAEASLFSGRPNPAWTVSEDAAKRLMQLWNVMPPTSQSAPSAPNLGYRGCALRLAGLRKLSGPLFPPKGAKSRVIGMEIAREWRAYGGIVTFMDSRSEAESREDPGRAFEKVLLSSAPPGLMPRGFVEFR